ncbi:MAG: tetratricopeptide repeat protein [Bacteroidetes bacterium]|nr:tetratricopeptide repeat protein [Bacteroidota bacterium]
MIKSNLSLVFFFIWSVSLCQTTSASQELSISPVSEKFPRKLINDGQSWVNSPNAKDQQTVGLGYLLMARGYSLLGEDDKSIKLVNQACAEFEKNKEYKSLFDAKLKLAEIYLSEGEFEKSSEVYVQLLNDAEDQSDTLHMILANNGLGIIFRNLREYYKAKQCYDNALEMCRQLNDDYCYSVTYKNLGTYYFYLKNYDKAVDFYQKSYTYWAKREDHEDQCGLINNIGNAFREKGDLDQAKKEYIKAFDISNALGSNYLHVVILKNLGILAIKEKKIPLALRYFNEAIGSAHNYGLIRIEQEILYQESVLKYQSGDYKSAYEKYTLYENNRDSIYTADRTENVIKLINKLETEKERKIIEGIKREHQIRELTNTRNILVLVLILLLMGVVVIVLIYGNRSKQKVTLALEDQRDRIMVQKDELAKLNRTLTEAQNNLESQVLQRTYELQRMNDLMREEMEERKKAVQSLHDYQEYLMELLNSVADPLFVKDTGHKWVLLNAAFGKFIGRKVEDLIGKSDDDIFLQEEAHEFWEKDDLVFATGEENENEELLTPEDGKTRTIRTKKQLNR